MIQGTLRIIFDLLALPQTNRGYFWDEEAFDGKRICDLFYDCLTDSMPPIEQFQVDGDLNAIDLEDEEEDEVQMSCATSCSCSLINKRRTIDWTFNS